MKSALLLGMLVLLAAGCKEDSAGPGIPCTGDRFLDAEMNGSTCLSGEMCHTESEMWASHVDKGDLILMRADSDPFSTECTDRVMLAMRGSVSGDKLVAGDAEVSGELVLGGLSYTRTEPGATATVDEVREDGTARGRFSIRLTDTTTGATVALTNGSFDTKEP